MLLLNRPLIPIGAHQTFPHVLLSNKFPPIYRVRDWVYQRSFTFPSEEGSLFGLPLRASNEHIPIVRVP